MLMVKEGSQQTFPSRLRDSDKVIKRLGLLCSESRLRRYLVVRLLPIGVGSSMHFRASLFAK